MPGIILTLSDLARSSGIKFALIEPVSGAVAGGSYETDRIHLLFNGDFYAQRLPLPPAQPRRGA